MIFHIHTIPRLLLFATPKARFTVLIVFCRQEEDKLKEKAVTPMEIAALALKVLAKREQVICCHLECVHEKVFLVTTTFTDQKMPLFEHFVYPSDATAYWKKLVEGLAGLPQPHCGLFNGKVLIAPVHIDGISWGRNNGRYFFQLSQSNGHSLGFQYKTEKERDDALSTFRKFLGMDEDGPLPLND